MPLVAANGLQIDAEVHGEPGAPVVLLIMGLGMPAALWPDPIVQTLTGAGYRVVTFDNRDAGGSTRLDSLPVPNVLRAIKSFSFLYISLSVGMFCLSIFSLNNLGLPSGKSVLPIPP